MLMERQNGRIERQVIELATGQGYGGSCLLSHDALEFTVYSFDRPFFIRSNGGPIHLRTSENELITLFDNIESGVGHGWRHSAEEMVVYKQNISFNLAFVGGERWKLDSKIGQVTFEVSGVENLLRHREKLRHFLNNPIFDSDGVVYKIDPPSYTLKIVFISKINIFSDYPVEPEIKIHVTYNDPVSIKHFREDIRGFVAYLSFLAGSRLVEDNVKVCARTEVDYEEIINRGDYAGFSDVYYRQNKEVRQNFFRSSADDLLTVSDDQEASSFGQCYAAWNNQLDEWSTAYTLMLNAFFMAGEVSGNRLMNACRWFENIPSARPLTTDSAEHVAKISEAALSEANRLGVDDNETKSRIVNALKSIGLESRREHIGRLKDRLSCHFGSSISDEKFVEHVMVGLGRLRGKAAHNHVAPTGAVEFRQLNKSITAIEAMCWLLTAEALPLSDAAKRRAVGHAMVLSYTESYGD